jgi:hypothetical protein
VVGETLVRSLQIPAPKGFYNSDVMLGRECHPASFAEVCPHVPPGDLPQLGNHGEQPPIRASLEERAVPFFFQANGTVGISPCERQLAIEFGQAIEPVGRGFAGEREGHGLKIREYGPNLPHFTFAQRAHAKAAAQIGLDYTFTNEAEESLAGRCSADAEGGSYLGVSKASSSREMATLDAIEYGAIDGIA